MKYRTLFSPLTVRGLTLKNRVVVSAMGCLMIGRDRKVSQQLADYLGERAKGGVGLIYSPCAAVDTGSCPEGMLAISTDETGDSHRLLTEAVHAGGAKCAAQLWQGSAIAFPARVYEPSETVLPAALYPALNGKDLVVPPMTKEEILDEGKVDLVVMARANLADPEFCNKAASGREDEIVYCIGCCQGCFDPHIDPENLLNDTHITCLRNPALGKEKEYAFVKTDSPKTVLIAGGGMGGMEAAYRLHMLGHKVVLCEAAGVLGGQFILAGESPRKGEFKKATADCARRLSRLGVEIRLNAPVDAALIESLRPDAVIIATGAEPIRLSLPGAELKPVYNSHDVLAHRAVPEGRVCIIGGGMVGLETAEFAAALGCKVTVVEMQGQLAADMGYLRKLCTLAAMAEEGIETIVNARCKAINGTGVIAERDGEELTIPCDTVVTAVGARSKPCDELKAACERLGIKYYVIGDAVQARRALNATAEGAAVAYEINKA